MNKNYQKQKFEKQRFGFVLYINKHTICERNFTIKNYNDEILHSSELKQLMDILVGMNSHQMGIIPKFLREQSMELLWNKYNPYFKPTEIKVNKNRFKDQDIFEFEIKVDGDVKTKSIFSGKWFQPSIRYDVNIKDIIPTIISEIRYYFS